MGLEINKLSDSTYIQKELTEINKLNTESAKNVEEDNQTSKQEKTDKDEHLDTYRKSSVVSNSIEKQIKEQEAKIKEINENLAVLRENYNETSEAEDVARSVRYQKERERYRKEVSENSLKRLFANWTRKYKANETDKSILKEYNSASSDYETAAEERRSADIAYDLADTEAFDAIAAHNSASAQFISGLWGKRDAYWDLAKMQRRLSIAKIQESMDR
ncbi:MAG: hypothetical protein NC200_05300 [Candidatus Gastranaerophilales bacterium]|nr:hypothetical protein [Candidatus Gastranaerophilales bacterium]